MVEWDLFFLDMKEGVTGAKVPDSKEWGKQFLAGDKEGGKACGCGQRNWIKFPRIHVKAIPEFSFLKAERKKEKKKEGHSHFFL